MEVQHFYDSRTSTLTYVAYDPAEKIGVVIDPVADFDPKSGKVWHESAEKVAAFIDERGLTIPYVIDTHAHADHLSGMPFIKERYGAKTVIGEKITIVQEAFRDIFNLGADFPVDGSQFDVLIPDGGTLEAGPLSICGMHTPGHTPACFTYQIGNALFVGDTLFMPDFGTARCDFPGGSAETLYHSIQKLYTLPGDTLVYTCHDYQPGGRELRWVVPLGEEKRGNVQLNEHTTKEEYVEFRRKRDAQLSMPALILPSLQVNIRAGALPPAEDNNAAYLKLPLNMF